MISVPGITVFFGFSPCKFFVGLNTFLVPYLYFGIHIGPLLKIKNKRCR